MPGPRSRREWARSSLLLTALAIATSVVNAEQWDLFRASGNTGDFASQFLRKPPESPPYMVDNTRDTHGVAPVNGKSNGPVWTKSGDFDTYMRNLKDNGSESFHTSNTDQQSMNTTYRARDIGNQIAASEDSKYWLPKLAGKGKAPLAGDDYKFYRNVLDYGADNTGKTNTEEAINAAIVDGDRCGEECGNTFAKGALIYFPPGTYKVCTPIIQYYYTQFVGDALDPPTIKGCDNFTGIALIDTDPYVPNQAQPDGTGVNWYINQNQFFRQIRNFIFDLTEMPLSTDEHDQKLVPTGVHWQVSQACSMHNLVFNMPEASSEDITHVGVFTENGSGGFVSNLRFNGGAIGWRVGSQQYTAIGLEFKNCITAVQMVWDWGFNWQRIQVDGGSIAFNISGRGGISGQGIGSISLIDSDIKNVPIAILTNNHASESPNIVIDNTKFENVGTIVQAEDKTVFLSGGSTTVDLWTHGRRYIGAKLSRESGFVKDRPQVSKALLDNGKLFTRSRPQYEHLSEDSFLVATEHGCKNDGTGDNTEVINEFLFRAMSTNRVAYFPAGIYSVEGTVLIPVDSRVQGTSWSQIQATGKYFEDAEDPQVVIRVGNEGDVGRIEISDMLFTVKGNTAGAIMMQWNVKADKPGAAAMWDAHIRVGGGIGTDLDAENCPKLGFHGKCACVSLLMHVTREASGYFENVWAWVADHDNDMSLYWEVDNLASQISLYGARGILVESQGPTWFYGTGSEHTIYYQYQVYKGKDIYLGHIQTESPYFQPEPASPTPFNSTAGYFPGDPDWYDCDSDRCREAWGLRIIESEGIVIHSAGLYSWFVNYEQDCLKSEDCQKRIMDIADSKNIAIYNVFAKGVEEVGSTEYYALSQKDTQQGYTSQICLWYPEDNLEVVYIGKELYEDREAACNPPCILVLPPSKVPEDITISPSPYTTDVQVGGDASTITITPKPVTTNKVEFSNVRVMGTESDGIVLEARTSIPLGNGTVYVPYKDKDGKMTSTERIIIFPPWPEYTNWPHNFNNRDNVTSNPTDNFKTRDPTPWTDPVDPKFTPTPTGTSIETPAPTEFSIIHMEPVYEDTESRCTETECEGEKDDDDHGAFIFFKVRCDDLWFFNFCIETDNHKIKGWKFRVGRSKIGPGPPPIVIDYPTRIIYPPVLPPWPEIEIVEPNKMKFSKKDPSCDDNKVSVPFEIYTRSYGLSVSDGKTVTTTTRTITETAYNTGCPTPEWTSTSACGIPQKRKAMETPTDVAVATPTVTPEASASTGSLASGIGSRAWDPEAEWNNDYSCISDLHDVIIYLNEYLTNDFDINSCEARLNHNRRKFGQRFHVFHHQDASDSIGYVFIYVWNMPKELSLKYARMPGVTDVSRPEPPRAQPQRRREGHTDRGWQSATANLTLEQRTDSMRDPWLNEQAWWRSHISSYPGEKLSYYGVENEIGEVGHPYYHGQHLGQDQVIYLIDDKPDITDKELASMNLEALPDLPIDIGSDVSSTGHGSVVGAIMVGRYTGIVPRAKMVYEPDNRNRFISAVTLVRLLQIVNQLEANKNLQGRCVINMSWSIGKAVHSKTVSEWGRVLGKLLHYLERQLKCVLVTSAGNFRSDEPDSKTQDRYPNLIQYQSRHLNMLIVGATGREGYLSYLSVPSNMSPDPNLVFAPGLAMDLSRDSYTDSEKSGTSFSCPLVAGVVASLRSMKESRYYEQFKEPENVVKMVKHLSRQVKVVGNNGDRYKYESKSRQPNIVWNGQVGKENCLTRYTSGFAKKICDKVMQGVPEDLRDWNPEASDSKEFTWSQGPPSPTCLNDCGTLCTGYYCQSTHKSAPPGHADPAHTRPAPTWTTTGTSRTTQMFGGLTDLPSLTNTPIPVTSCAGQIKPTTICNGSGGRMACVTSSYCSSEPTPTPTDMLCQINRGCTDYPCPQGGYGWCSGGHCKCRDEKPPETQECFTSQNCQSFACTGGRDPFCDDGYCGCKNKKCSSIGDCSAVSCSWDERTTCSSNGCTCEAVSFSMQRTIHCERFGQGCYSEAVLTDKASEWTISNARDGCRKPKPFIDLCIDEKRNRLKFRLPDDIPRCLVGGNLVAEGDCPNQKNHKCVSADWDQVQCTW